MTTPLETAIEENALGPKKVKTDEIDTEMHSIEDQIAADTHIGRKEARGRLFSSFAQQAKSPGA